MRLKKNIWFIAILIVLSLAACSKGSTNDATEPSDEELDNLNEEGFPIVDEEISLDFFARHDPASNEDWNDVFIFNEYAEMTNMNINFEMIPSDSVDEKMNLAFGGGNLPDVFHASFMGSPTLMKYGEQGILLPLNDLIDEYAPNFKALMEEYPEIEQSITMPDGNIYGFPSLGDPDFLSYRTAPMLYINEVWLDELGMDMPETTDEFYEYLKAVKEEQPGDVDGDVIPFGAPTANHLYENLRGSFGVATKGAESGYMDEDPETGDYRFYATSDNYKELLQYMNKLYEEELLEKNIFSIEHDQFLANSSEGKYGSTVWYSPTHVMGETVGGQYTGMPSLEGPHGDKTFVNVGGPVGALGSFVLTKENEYPAASVRWIDYFYGDEGIEMFFMGKEGDTFEKTDDGEYEYTKKVVGDDEKSFTEQVSKYFTFPGGGQATMIKQEFFKDAESSEISVEAAEKLEDDLIENAWPELIHTEEENKKLQGFGNDIEKYVEEMRDKFISGNESFDNWDKYVSEVEKMNLDEYIDIKINAIERQVE